MRIIIACTGADLGRQAAAQVASELIKAVRQNGSARCIVATGASQFAMLENLVVDESIPWTKITLFHLDEYVGLGEEHPASFRRYLKERLLARLPQAPAAFHFVDGDGDLKAECDRLGRLISEAPVDVACVGIGENGHLAFNDPPADFETKEPYNVVELDEACRQQQMGEGWFATLQDVPERAISMSIHQIMLARSIVCCVPDERKAQAVKMTLESEITPQAPASILRRHAACTLYLDEASSSLLKGSDSA